MTLSQNWDLLVEKSLLVLKSECCSNILLVIVAQGLPVCGSNNHNNCKVEEQGCCFHFAILNLIVETV